MARFSEWSMAIPYYTLLSGKTLSGERQQALSGNYLDQDHSAVDKDLYNSKPSLNGSENP